MAGMRYEVSSGGAWYGIGAHLLRSRLRAGGHDPKKVERIMAKGGEFQLSELTRVRQHLKWGKKRAKKKAKKRFPKKS